MGTVDQIRSNLIDRLSTITNLELLNAVDQFLESASKNDGIQLKEFLKIREEDLNNEEDEWLVALFSESQLLP